jgi:hypothetical protein
MLNVLEPIDAKLEFKLKSIAVTTVKIPTKAVMPRAIIIMVNIVRKSCVRIEPNAIFTFSLINPIISVI